MPELPEVETTRRGLLPHLLQQAIHGVILRRPDLRWPIPDEVEAGLSGRHITDIRRRAKYLNEVLARKALADRVFLSCLCGSEGKCRC